MADYSLDEKAPMCVGWGMEKSSMKKPKLKARRMWANYYPNGESATLYTRKKLAQVVANSSATASGVPVAVIPLDDVPRMVRKAMLGFSAEESSMFEPAMYAALAAIGVLPRAKAKKKGCK